MIHHHHQRKVRHQVEHDHPLSDHDEDGRHTDGTFMGFDLLFGPICVEKDHAESSPTVEDDADGM